MTGFTPELERVLPEAPHWNGHGKYGPALCMDECTLHIMSRGFGAKDGDGYLTFDPNKFDWDRDDEGSEFMVVPLSNSDLLFLRDKLNKLFPCTEASGIAELTEALKEAVSHLRPFASEEEFRVRRKGYEVLAKIGGNDG